VQVKNLEQETQVNIAAKKMGQISRYIPAKIHKIIDEEQGDKCCVPGCLQKAEVTHHEIPFAVAKNHDPFILRKLCKAHHEIAHMINVKFYEHARHAQHTRHARSGAKCGYDKSGR
jgi:hypothetical protein